MTWLQGKKTYIVFGLALLNELARVCLGIDSLPAIDPMLLAIAGLVLRFVTKSA